MLSELPKEYPEVVYLKFGLENFYGESIVFENNACLELFTSWAEEEEELGEEQTRGEEVVEEICGEEVNAQVFDGEDCGMEMICGGENNKNNGHGF